MPRRLGERLGSSNRRNHDRCRWRNDDRFRRTDWPGLSAVIKVARTLRIGLRERLIRFDQRWDCGATPATLRAEVTNAEGCWLCCGRLLHVVLRSRVVARRSRKRRNLAGWLAWRLALCHVVERLTGGRRYLIKARSCCRPGSTASGRRCSWLRRSCGRLRCLEENLLLWVCGREPTKVCGRGLAIASLALPGRPPRLRRRILECGHWVLRYRWCLEMY